MSILPKEKVPAEVLTGHVIEATCANMSMVVLQD